MLRPSLITLGLGFVYFIGAIPTGTLMGLPSFAAALLAWTGYCLGALVMLLIGKPARDFFLRLFKISLKPDPKRLFWRIWDRYGLTGMGLVAPFTIGPQVAVILGLSLQTPPLRLFSVIALGAIPSTLFITLLLSLGFALKG